MCVCVQLLPYDVKYGSLRITDYKLLKRAVRDMGYPPVISCAVTYREELRRTGRPVWVCLDLLGADTETELTFMCKAYEEVGCQQLDGSRNGELKSRPTVRRPLQHLQCRTVHSCYPASKLSTYCLFCSYTLSPPISCFCCFTVPTDPSPNHGSHHSSSGGHW